MDLQRKIEIGQTSITNISRADDQDSAIRHAALGALEKFISAEREAIDARLAEKIKSHLGVTEEAPAA